MANYEYVCAKDGKFSVTVSITKHRSVLRCPKCYEKCEQIFSAVAPAIFKGSGFHCNSYPNSATR